MKKKGGLRRKTRSLFKKHDRERGNVSLKKHLQSFKDGEKVRLSLESSVQGGMYHPMFYGKMGTVRAKRGKCYEILITDGGKQKTLIVHPVHLKQA